MMNSNVNQEKAYQAVMLRGKGVTYADIGMSIGVSTSRARHFVETAKPLIDQGGADMFRALTKRAYKAAVKLGAKTKADVARMISSGEISTSTTGGVGLVSYSQLVEFSGADVGGDA